MDATSLLPDAPLPEDVPTLQAMLREFRAEVARLRQENAQLLAELERLKTENADLRSRLDAALKHRFGQRSERQRQPKTKPEESEQKNKPKNRHEHGRSPLPENLERRTILHDLSEQEKLCPCCGEVRQCIGEQATEQLEKQPAKFYVRRTVRRTYACKSCDPALASEERFQTAGPAEVGPIARGLCGPGLLAWVITSKYADHVPLNRLAGQVERSGVHIARSTLGGWMAQAADLLRPLYELMKARLLLSRVIHSDDTGVKLRVADKDKTAKAHFWAYIGDADYPYVLLDFTADYTKQGPQEFLKGYKGYLQADALAQYECLFGPAGAKHVCCLAHSRRKFVQARDGGDKRAAGALELIGQLYAIERELPALLCPTDDPAEQEKRVKREEERKQARQTRAVPILEKWKGWLDTQKGKVLAKSPLGEAIGYALNNWEALKRYVEEGYLSIDNNLSERTLRAIAIGRNNWGVIGSEAGGETAEVLYSLTLSCKHLGIDPLCYLEEALSGIFALGEKPSAEQLMPWLPDRWWWCRQRDSPVPAASAS